MPVALGSEVLTGGASSKGASRSCQRCWKALSGQIGRANGRPVVAVYFSPRRVYTSESVCQADLGARRLRMSSQHSSGGGRPGRRTWRLPSAVSLGHSLVGPSARHRKLAPGVWRGDGLFRYELPNKIPVPEANSTSQMDKVGG